MLDTIMYKKYGRQEHPLIQLDDKAACFVNSSHSIFDFYQMFPC